MKSEVLLAISGGVDMGDLAYYVKAPHTFLDLERWGSHFVVTFDITSRK